MKYRKINTLPEPIKVKVYEYAKTLNEEPIDDLTDNDELMCAFPFHLAPEGADYWLKVNIGEIG